MLFLQALTMLLMTLGPRRAMKAIWQHPSLLLMPTFSIWTYGPTDVKSLFTSCFGSKLLKVSFPLSWVNLIFKIVPPLCLGLMFFKEFGLETFLQHIFKLLPVIILAPITLILIQLLGKCSEHFQLKFTVFDPEKPDEVIPWPKEDSKNQETNDQLQMS